MPWRTRRTSWHSHNPLQHWYPEHLRLIINCDIMLGGACTIVTRVVPGRPRGVQNRELHHGRPPTQENFIPSSSASLCSNRSRDGRGRAVASAPTSAAVRRLRMSTRRTAIRSDGVRERGVREIIVSSPLLGRAARIEGRRTYSAWEKASFIYIKKVREPPARTILVP